MSTGKVLLGVLAGAAIGASLGILFAPDKGSSTRKKISNKSDEYVEELSGKLNGFIDAITSKFETMSEEAIRLAEKGKMKTEMAVATNEKPR